MADLVPVDILVNHILLGLSIKCLLRCRCVCKQWYKLISGSEFTNLHMQLQKKHNKKVLCGPLRCRIELVEPSLEARSGIFYSLDLESISSPTLTRLPGFPVHQINDYILGNTLGYSNGMLCMLARRRGGDVGSWRHIFFGNPSTGFYKILPNQIDDGPLVVGFGYDLSVDDYKFVRVDNVTRNPHVYCLKSNLWTTNLRSRNKHTIFLTEYTTTGIIESSQAGSYLEGTIYWFVAYNNKIVKFDLVDETFTELPGPRAVGRKCLKVVQASLCIINTLHHAHRVYVDMWRLVNDSWMKMTRVDMYAREIYPLFFAEDGRIICCVEKEGPGLLNLMSEYALIDQDTGKIEKLNISGTENCVFDKFIFRAQYSGYTHSLVSPNFIN